MKPESIFFILITIIVLISPAYGQNQSLISVQIDSSSYSQGDIIVISGKVTTVVGTTPVIIQIFSGDNLVNVAQITVAQDGTFSTTVITEGPLWTKGGEYIVRATYGEGNIAETEFNFKSNNQGPIRTSTFEVNAGSRGSFDVEYTITGGIVKDMRIDSNMLSLFVTIEPSEKGTILLEIPRNALDAKKQDSSDEVFIVLIDGLEVVYQENKIDPNSRTITVNFEKGDKEIQIIGTTIIPEFGVIASMILLAGILFTIVFGRKIPQII